MNNTKTQKQPDLILFSSDSRGVYIPQYFAEAIRREGLSNVSAEALKTLEAGPEHDYYWDTWCDVCDSAEIVDLDSGVKYSMHQDGDLWLVPEGMEWDEGKESFGWPVDMDSLGDRV